MEIDKKVKIFVIVFLPVFLTIVTISFYAEHYEKDIYIGKTLLGMSNGPKGKALIAKSKKEEEEKIKKHEEKRKKDMQNNFNSMIQNVEFYKHTKTGLCFAIFSDWKILVTHVPCTLEVEQLIVTKGEGK